MHINAPAETLPILVLTLEPPPLHPISPSVLVTMSVSGLVVVAVGLFLLFNQCASCFGVLILIQKNCRRSYCLS